MSTIKASNIQNGSSASVNIALNTDGSATFAQMPVPPSPYAMRNKIINGAMEIDQRNAGASVTVNNTVGGYGLDRWYYENNSGAGVFTLQQVSDAPSGFVNSLKITTTTADATLNATDRALIAQKIEGYNIIDFAFGTSSAKSITLSFWCKCSLTGTFGGVITNNAGNRSYPFTYTINVASTWEYKTVTISGDITGTWLTNNSAGAILIWGLGVGSTYSGTAGAWAAAQYLSATGGVNVIGTNSATWQITGVQLEVGSTATPFERRLINQEFAMCQRYYEIVDARWCNGVTFTANGDTRNNIPYAVTKRSTPTVSATGSAEVIAFGSAGDATNVNLGTITVRSIGTFGAGISGISNFGAFSGCGGTMAWGDNSNGNLKILANAEI